MFIKELFVSKVDPGSPRGERKFSAATAPSMKTKWLKAIKSLKPASGSAAQADSLIYIQQPFTLINWIGYLSDKSNTHSLLIPFIVSPTTSVCCNCNNSEECFGVSVHVFYFTKML
ncbi:hypothetical protein FF38_00619 [Lucilia cuprina]|uniref:Uncharacterized protein n=1 Tax=Lucilia cuprina TaxID=7375 RepID=A0A0L0BXU5_LUCCU|nr:hypothetical protein FF38_00619 [Lucilia cuprina]